MAFDIAPIRDLAANEPTNSETPKASPEEIASIISIPRATTATGTAVEKSAEELNKDTADTSGVTKLPSITAVLARQVGESPKFSSSKYAEENDARLLNSAMDKANIVQSNLQDIDKKSPEQRAQIGGKLGAGVGLALDGPMGALMGAGMGAVAARGMGLAKSGENEDIKRSSKVLDSLQLMGISGEDNRVQFSDGNSFLLTPDPSARLENTSAIFGKADRTMFELDNTSPFTKRSATVARPLARYLAQGILGYGNKNNPRDVNAIDNTTKLFVNILQNDVDSVASVYSRAKQLADKMGVTEEAIRTFYDANKTQIDAVEAAEIRRGLDIIYA